MRTYSAWVPSIVLPRIQPPLAQCFEVLCELTRELAQHGRFNYHMSNGEYLIAHCTDRLCYILRHAPFAQAHLIDDDVTVDFSADPGWESYHNRLVPEPAPMTQRSGFRTSSMTA